MSAQQEWSPEEVEARLADDIGGFVYDMAGYVDYAFPWKEEGSQLEAFEGMDDWQRDLADKISECARAHDFDPFNPDPVEAIRVAVTSGHGIGKSGFVGMLCCWIQDTRPGSKGTVTANTANQLRARTFNEIKKWRKMSITAHWYDILDGEMLVEHKEQPDTWFLKAIAWDKHRSEAFAGQHAIDSSSFYVFDEASAIEDVIFEVAEGGLTDGEPMIFLFGNPTRNKGKLFAIFHRERHMWIVMQIDSRTCSFPNKTQIAKWIDLYGEDSDFVRVRVKGLFPRSASKQLISGDLVGPAMRITEPVLLIDDPLVLGVDVARFGDDESVVAYRAGRDARSIPWDIYRSLDGHQLGSRIAESVEILRRQRRAVSQIFVDITGVGSSCFDRLLHLGYPVVPVNFGGKADSERDYVRKDAEMWVRIREWLKIGGALPDDAVLEDQLTMREYEYNPRMQLFIQPKGTMKADGGAGSPDRADALALTFAFPVAPVNALQAIDELDGIDGSNDAYDPWAA